MPLPILWALLFCYFSRHTHSLAGTQFHTSLMICGKHNFIQPYTVLTFAAVFFCWESLEAITPVQYWYCPVFVVLIAVPRKRNHHHCCMSSCYLNMHRNQDLLQRTAIIWQQREIIRFIAILAHFSYNRYSWFLQTVILRPFLEAMKQCSHFGNLEVEVERRYCTTPLVSISLTQAKFCSQ